MAELKIAKLDNREKVIEIYEIDPKKVADEISNALRKCGLGPLSNEVTLEFVQKAIDNQNRTTDAVAQFMEIKKERKITRRAL